MSNMMSKFVIVALSFSVSGVVAQMDPSLWDKSAWVLIAMAATTAIAGLTRELKRRVDKTEKEKSERIVKLEISEQDKQTHIETLTAEGKMLRQRVRELGGVVDD